MLSPAVGQASFPVPEQSAAQWAQIPTVAPEAYPMGMVGLPPAPAVATLLASAPDGSLYFGADGVRMGDSGIRPYSRGYNAVRDAVLLTSEGSMSQGEALGQSAAKLDALAARLGYRTRFTQIAVEFSNLAAPHWWGMCNGWAHVALMPWANAGVDVPGVEGAKGIVIEGVWFSRAELGQWLMAVANTISTRDVTQVAPTAENLLKVIHATLMNKGSSGFWADIHNDRAEGTFEVWNQPFVAANVTTSSAIPLFAAHQILQLADAEARSEAAAALGLMAANLPRPRGVQVKLVHAEAFCGAEVNDAHEGAPHVKAHPWTFYVVLDATGRMLRAYTANDPRVASVAGLPVTTSKPLPDHIALPGKSLELLARGVVDANVASDPYAQEMHFFVNHVLKHGVRSG